MAELDTLLQNCASNNYSDVHIASHTPIMGRSLGELRPIDNQIVNPSKAQSLILDALTPQQKRAFEENWELDAVYTSQGGLRFRVNVCREHHGVAAVFRHIPRTILTLAELGLPPVVEKFCLATQGLILVSGPSRSGKSTTLASLIDHINTTRNDHIITIEDPIEVIHQNKSGIISQRELATHTRSFASALRAALREDPDVIMVGEIRDTETMTLAMTAAETGHLVLSSLHTSGAVATINRALNLFPPGEQEQARSTLSESMLGIISQQLIKNAADADMVAAFEVLVNTLGVANVIREGDAFKIEGMLQVGGKDGMKSMATSLEELWKKNLITREARMEYSGKEVTL